MTARWSSLRSPPRPTGIPDGRSPRPPSSTSFRRRRALTTRRTPPSRSPQSAVTTSTSGRSAIGFDYGDAFRSIQSVTAGEDWAVAEIAVPPAIVDEFDHFRFHPALIDGAFQTLFGAPFLGQEENKDPYPAHPDTPLRGLRCTRRAHEGPRSRPIGDRRRGRERHHDHRPRREGARRLRRVLGAVAERLVAYVTRAYRQGTVRDSVGRHRRRRARSTSRAPQLVRPGSSSPTTRASARPSPTSCVAAATASSRSNTNRSVGSPRSAGVT